MPDAEIDFRPGGVCAVCMRSPDGQDFWSRGHYIEIVPPDRLVFTSGVGDADAPKFTAHTTVTFEDDSGGTRMTVHQAYEIHDESFRFAVEGAAEGWRTTLDKLEKEVARIRQAAEGRSVVHATFRLERTYAASPAAVFHALSDRAAKARWFEGGDGYVVLEREMDVRPGGRERVKGRWASGTVSTFDAIYHDVVPNERLVYGYEMHLDDRKISVSLATLELQPVGAQTRLVVTEQGAFLDGYDDAGSREQGTGFLLDRLGASLRGCCADRIEFRPWPHDFHGGRTYEDHGMGRTAQRHLIFETASGFCGIAWNGVGITRFQLPTRSAAATERLLLRRVPGAEPGAPTPEVAEAVAAVRRYFEGEETDFSGVTLDLGEQDALFTRIYAAARQVRWGHTTTYGALAKQVGAGPEVARDVGQAMAQNPVALIIPCHRVLAAGGKVGGFSAPGGSASKARMLELEGVRVEPPPPAQRSFGFLGSVGSSEKSARRSG